MRKVYCEDVGIYECMICREVRKIGDRDAINGICYTYWYLMCIDNMTDIIDVFNTFNAITNTTLHLLPYFKAALSVSKHKTLSGRLDKLILLI